MKAQVITLLKSTPAEYEAFLLDFYFDWCAKKSNNDKLLQKLLTCPPLFAWWQRELEHLEAQFVEDAQFYQFNLTAADAYKLYRLNTAQLHTIFCKPLIKMAYDR